MSKKLNRLIVKFQKLNREMVVELIASKGISAEDFANAAGCWQNAVKRAKKMPVSKACYADGMDLLMLEDCGYEESDRTRALKLFVQLDKQRGFLAKLAPKTAFGKSDTEI